jgi:hypothetical protein
MKKNIKTQKSGASVSVIIGWLLTYLLPLALIAFGTATQGDDSEWAGSLFLFGPIVALGIFLLLLSWSSLHKHRLLGVGHLLSLCLAIIILPNYWQRVTFGGSHIAAGMSEDYIDSFAPEPWHAFWAPVMTIFVVAVVVFNIVAWKRKN